MASFAPPPGSSAGAQPMPPLPDLPTAGNAGSDPGAGGGLASLMSGIAPVKSAVDAINGACKQIVQSGVIPGSEQICAQIVALATSLLPMAAQSLMGAGGGGGMSAMPPPPGGPQPMGPPPGGPPQGGM